MRLKRTEKIGHGLDQGRPENNDKISSSGGGLSQGISVNNFGDDEAG